MKIKPKQTFTALALLTASLLAGCGSGERQGAATSSTAPHDDFGKSVAEFIEKFPYQDTYEYAMTYTGGEPGKFNTWVIGAKASLVKAGEDKIVRMNNDTYYKLAFLVLDQGPVVLASANPSTQRFSSFQLMDDHNVNFRNLIHPSGEYTLYHGKKPDSARGEAVESPSSIVAVIVRVEVKDMGDDADIAEAKNVFGGITIEGPTVKTIPKLDLLSAFDKKVEAEALKRIDEVFETADFSNLVAGPGDVPEKVSYLQLAAGTKGGWGGPVTSHSAYETIFFDENNEEMKGANGTYSITTEEPPVDAFWSITIYDTGRGGFLHPNEQDRYHINNTSAVENADGTFTFTFKQKCNKGDLNCLEVPAGRFDYAIRYYLPKGPIRSGAWRMSKPVLQK